MLDRTCANRDPTCHTHRSSHCNGFSDSADRASAGCSNGDVSGNAKSDIHAHACGYASTNSGTASDDHDTADHHGERDAHQHHCGKRYDHTDNHTERDAHEHDHGQRHHHYGASGNTSGERHGQPDAHPDSGTYGQTHYRAEPSAHLRNHDRQAVFRRAER